MGARSITVSRRGALLLAGSAIGLSSAGLGLRAPALAGGQRAGSDVAALGEQIRSLFSDLPAARSLGERYLASCPAAHSEALRLARDLRRARPAGPGEVRALIAGRGRADAGRRAVAIVDGWVLPKAEAQACALAVLL